jgi:septal ring factor EnvC (AmiA/AmiB activator)
MTDPSRYDGRVPEPPYRTDAYAEYSDSIEIASLRQQLAQERERAEKHLKDLSDHASEIAEARDMLRAKLAAAEARSKELMELCAEAADDLRYLISFASGDEGHQELPYLSNPKKTLAELRAALAQQEHPDA